MFISRLRSSPTLKNAFASYFASLSIGLSGILSIPIAVHFLNKEEIGLWAVVGAIVNYLTWMDLGIGDGIGRKLAVPVAAKDQEEINRWWTVSIVALSVLGFVLTIMAAATTPWIIDFFDIPPALKEQSYFLFIGAIVLVGVGMPYRGVPGLLTAQHRFHWASVAHGIAPWVSMLGFYISLKNGLGVGSYVIGMSASILFTGILFWVIVARGENRPRFDCSGIKISRLKELLGLSLNISVLGIVEAIFSTLPSLVIARFGGLAAVPVYTITSRAPIFLASLVRRTLWAFYPQLLRLHVTGQKDVLLSKHKYVSMFTLGIALFVAGGAIGFNRTIVGLLAGSSFYAGVAADWMLACMIILDPVSRVFLCLLYLAGNMGRVAMVSLFAVAVGVISSLLGYKHFGFAGLAASMAVMPLFLGIYGYFHGGKNGIFKGRKISTHTVSLTLVSCAALIISCVLIPQEVTNHANIFGRVILLPDVSTFLVAIVCMIAGIGISVRSLSRLRA